jgi:hypothetical protein
MFDTSTLPQNTQVIVPLSEFIPLFQGLIREEFKVKYDQEMQGKLLSPKQVCNLFSPKISLPTLASWADKGLLIKYSIDGRTWYKYSEVMAALKTLKRYQRQPQLQDQTV